MLKSQLDNLIRFSFLFHKTMDCDWVRQSPDYIWEKWQAYFGFTPDEQEIYPEDTETIKWLKLWDVSNGDWQRLKSVVKFIRIVNSRPLVGGPSVKWEHQWSPSELIELFEKIFGDRSKITQIEYRGLHILIDHEIEHWIWQTDYKRDYNLNLLV